MTPYSTFNHVMILCSNSRVVFFPLHNNDHDRNRKVPVTRTADALKCTRLAMELIPWNDAERHDQDLHELSSALS